MRDALLLGRIRSGLVCAVLLVAGSSAALAQAPEVGGTLIVVNKGAASASIVDVSTGQILKTLPTGEGPHEVVVSSDGSMAVVTDYGARSGGNTLTVIDVPGLAVARTIDLGEHRRPHGIDFMPGEQVVAVTTEQSGHVVLVNVQTGEIISALPTEGDVSHMLAIPGSADLIYTSDIRDATVTEIEVARGASIRKFKVPVTPEAVGVTPDGSEVWVGSNDLGVVSVVDTESGEVTQALEGFGWPYRIVFSEDGETALLPDLRGNELRIVDVESRSDRARVSFPDAGPQSVVFSADGKYVFQTLSLEDRVAVIELESGSVIGYLPAGYRPDGLAHTARVVE
ncbi:MAG: YncE family protein [Gemmatimonadota bacterium]